MMFGFPAYATAPYSGAQVAYEFTGPQRFRWRGTLAGTDYAEVYFGWVGGLSWYYPRLYVVLDGAGTGTIGIQWGATSYVGRTFSAAAEMDFEILAMQDGADVQYVVKCPYATIMRRESGVRLPGGYLPWVIADSESNPCWIEWNGVERYYDWTDWRDWSGSSGSGVPGLPGYWTPILAGPTILQALPGAPTWLWTPTRVSGSGYAGPRFVCTAGGVAVPSMDIDTKGAVATRLACWQTDDGIVWMLSSCFHPESAVYAGGLVGVAPGEGGHNYSGGRQMEGLYPAATRLLPSNDALVAYIDHDCNLLVSVLTYVPDQYYPSYTWPVAATDTGVDGLMCGAAWVDDTGVIWLAYTDLSGNAQTIHSSNGGSTWS